MDWFTQNKQALGTSLAIFAVLFILTSLMATYYDFSKVDLELLLFILATLGCVFVAKNTFDTARLRAISDSKEGGNITGITDASEGIYVQLYKNSPVPYMIIDHQGHIQSANIAAVRMLGVRQNKVEGINIFSKLKCEKLEHLDFLIEKFRSGVSVSGELVEVKRADNRQSWGLLSLFRFENFSGDKIGLLALVDITKQKKAEDAKSEFVSLASHQLRTPIAGMKWSTELLLMDSPENLTGRQRKYIDRLLISIKRMAILVDDFLRVSRFELGTFQPEYKTVNLSVLFEDIILEQAPRATQKKLVVKTFFDESINLIVTDHNLIRMIVTNIYSNATKYTREGGTIHVGFSAKNNDIAITVADNGMGIPAGDQDEIFSKLFRAANAVRDVPDGTGLGLYIVREAVSVLQGKVTFTTTENVGTTFEVILPLELAPSELESKTE
jgi:PAS domain S-box-containing protein